MDESTLYHYLERISNLLRAEARQASANIGLQPVHLQVLSYFSQCNRYSNTTAAVTEYLGATKGTTSQTLRLLERKGYIERQVDTIDRRIQHLQLSKAGSTLLEKLTPPHFFRQAHQQLLNNDACDSEHFLSRLLRELQIANGSNTFGVCQTCHFFQSDGKTHQCGLTHERLQNSDINKICREHIAPETN